MAHENINIVNNKVINEWIKTILGFGGFGGFEVAQQVLFPMSACGCQFISSVKGRHFRLKTNVIFFIKA